MLFAFAIVKIVVIVILQCFCKLSGGQLTCLIIGSILEYLGAVLLGDWENFIVRELFYYAGILLQVIPMYIVSSRYLALPNEQMNFIKAIALGWVCVSQLAVWIGNAFEGAGGFIFVLSASIVYFILGAILNALCSLHTLLVTSFVIGSIALGVTVLLRLILGSNME